MQNWWDCWRRWSRCSGCRSSLLPSYLVRNAELSICPFRTPSSSVNLLKFLSSNMTQLSSRTCRQKRRKQDGFGRPMHCTVLHASQNHTTTLILQLQQAQMAVWPAPFINRLWKVWNVDMKTNQTGKQNEIQYRLLCLFACYICVFCGIIKWKSFVLRTVTLLFVVNNRWNHFFYCDINFPCLSFVFLFVKNYLLHIPFFKFVLIYLFSGQYLCMLRLIGHSIIWT